MNKLLPTIAFTLFSVSTFASELTVIDNSFGQPRTRAEVVTELQAAIARGSRPVYGEASPAPELAAFVSSRTRDEVRAEVLAAIKRGEQLSWGEASPDPLAASQVAPRGGDRTAHHEAPAMLR